MLDTYRKVDPVISIDQEDTFIVKITKRDKLLIVSLIVPTNYVPEVSVRHEELTLFKNIRCKLRLGSIIG
jgi:hypothetical protein